MVSFAGCKKKEEKPQLPPGHPSTRCMRRRNADMPKIDRKVMSERGAAKWKAVKLTVEDKTKKPQRVHDQRRFGARGPGTKMKLTIVRSADFRMGEKDITSASDKPNNPAAQSSYRNPASRTEDLALFHASGIHRSSTRRSA